MSKDVKEKKSEIAADQPQPAETGQAAGSRPVLTPEEKKRKYQQGVVKLLIAILLGFGAGAVAYMALGTAVTLVWFLVLAVAAIIAYYIQRRVLYPVLKLDLPERGVEWLGNAALVIIYCVLMWAFLLNVGAPAWVEEPAFDNATNEVTFALDREAVVSYVILDEEAARRSRIDFSNATPVTISPSSDGKTDTVYKGSFTDNVDGKYTYIRAVVDSRSYNESYVKAKIYELDLTPVPEEEVRKKSLFESLFGLGS
ncbi:hypothetical protein J5839_03550 [Methanosarcinaceae archaeon]|nr:hypothetical protein [Methanosarcinaceae archaeon]